MKGRLLTFIQNAIGTIFDNKGIKILSIVLAILLSIVSNPKTRELRLNGIPIEYQGIPQGLEIIDDHGTQVSVRVQGPSSLISGLMPNQVFVVADLTKREVGERIVQLHPYDVSLPEHIKVLQIVPSSIRLTLAQTATKLVRILPRTSDDLNKQLEVYDIDVKPPLIEIEGPERLINATETLSTETVNLKDRSGSFKVVVDVEPDSSAIRVKTREPIELTITIGEKRIIRQLSHIQVYPGSDLTLPGGAVPKIEPRFVNLELFGPKSLLDSLRAEEVRVEIYNSGLTDGSSSLKQRVVLPNRSNGLITTNWIRPSIFRLVR